MEKTHPLVTVLTGLACAAIVATIVFAPGAPAVLLPLRWYVAGVLSTWYLSESLGEALVIGAAGYLIAALLVVVALLQAFCGCRCLLRRATARQE